MFNRKKDRFSIRKFTTGVGSVLLGTLLLSAPIMNVVATETTASAVAASDSGTKYEGKEVTPTVTVTPNLSATGQPPTAYNRSKVAFDFGDQKLHKGDYFVVESENNAIEMPSAFIIKDTSGKQYTIATVEKMGYETDIMKATNATDATRFNMAHSNDILSSRRKYKVTFTDDVEGLLNVKAEMSFSVSKEVIFSTDDRQSTFKISVNGNPVFAKEFTIPAFDEKNGTAKQHELNSSADRTYRSFDLTIWDYRPQGANKTDENLKNIGFFKDLTAEGFAVINGQVSGFPQGFKMSFTSTKNPGEPGAFTFPADKMRINEKLPVKWAPYSVDGKRQANSNDGKLYVTPDNMYYIIDSITDNGRTINLSFFGDYSKPGYLTLGALNLDDDVALGKSSRIVTNFSNPNPAPAGTTDIFSYKFVDSATNEESEVQGGVTGKYLSYDFTAAASGVPASSPNADEVLGKGSVIVNYVDVDGNLLKDKDSVVAKSNEPVGSEYDTTDSTLKPELIEKDNITYRLVQKEGPYTVGTVGADNNLVADSSENDLVSLTDATGVNPKGTVAQGTRYVTYVYEAIKGNVVVNYKTVDGLPLSFEKDGAVVSQRDAAKDRPINEAYNTLTPELRPETITTPAGKTYRLVVKADTYPVGQVDKNGHLTSSDAIDGTVTENTQTITYVYEEVTGNVVVQYKTVDGEEIAPQADDTVKGAIESKYNTVDLRPETITKEGKTYKLVKKAGPYTVGQVDKNGHLTSSAAEEGTVIEGTQTVIYVYEEVKGDVVVHYKRLDDSVTIKGDYVDTNPVSVGTGYDATQTTEDGEQERPTKITFDSKEYELVEAMTQGSPVGNVVEGTTHITYYYREVVKPNGSVIVHYVEEGTDKIISKEVIDTPSEPVGTEYNTDDYKPTRIYTDDKKIYELVRLQEGKPGNSPETGTVTEEPTHVTYEYREVKGKVIVHYVDMDGNELKEDREDTPSSSVGTPYNTGTDDVEKPKEIEKDGKIYELVPSLTKGHEEGNVVEGITEVTYVYKLKEDKTGHVVVHYVNTNGDVIHSIYNDTTNAKVGEPYNTNEDTLEKPVFIRNGDKTYKYKEISKGNVVNNKVIVQKSDTDHVVPDETGTVLEGTTHVIYVYEEVIPEEVKKGKVTVKYEDTSGKEIKKPVEDTPESPMGTYYETADKKEPKITAEDGTVYYPIEKPVKEGSDPEKGTIQKPETTVTYVYEKAGSVIVKYVDENGVEIKTSKDVERNEKPGKHYDTTTTTLRPNKIEKDGKTYVLVSKGLDYKVGEVDENGRLVKGDLAAGSVESDVEKVVTYVYKLENTTPTEKLGKYVPYIPKDPKKPTDPNDPLSPTNPTTGKDIDPVPYDATPKNPKDNPPLRDVEGYVPVNPKDPKTPLTPVDPKNPTKGYIPPEIKNPDDATVDTPVPYVPAGTVKVHYVDESGKVIQDPTVDTPKSPVGTGYNTNEDEKEIPEVITGKDGKQYILVKVKDEDKDKQKGEVIQGNIDVTYIYKLVETRKPGIPPVIPTPEQPKSDKPLTPTKPSEQPSGKVTSPVLPHTGETGQHAMFYGATALGLGLMVAALRKRLEEEAE
ncbi:YSIRK-type signal peptide-containing protein [Granulicatella sp. zg-ZJ]|uniref:MucBP domain-containing protein n=1 Tax=Granulicatella sp. zg-ZJ TaxID=2678504 RepID=UPI0013D4478A|nr:MucBP domain-containing protein [Granulicatella sp. zg-ZJ]NEW61897.1 YSIRK-type signal peptide-containing protein [Granulicatella sp. zg-ZJ]